MKKSAMEKLLDSVLINIAKSNPSTPLTINRKNEIENRFRQLIPSLKTPSHPPYALMIQTAITELNEKRGSSKASISTYIKKEYDGLPWAHASYLSHYLEKLREKDEIFITRSKCYKLLNLGRGPKEVTVKKQKRKRDKIGGKSSIEKENQSHEQQVGLNDEKEPKRQGIRLRFIRKPKGENEGTKDQNESKWLRIEVVEKQEPSRDRNGQIEKEKHTEETFPLQDEYVTVMTESLPPCHDGIEHEQQEKVSDPTSQQETMAILYNVPDHQPLDAPFTMEQSSQTQDKTRQLRLMRQLEWSMDINPASIEETCQPSEKLPRTRFKRKQFISSTFKPQQSQSSPQYEFADQGKSLAIVQFQEETAMEPLFQSQWKSPGRKPEAKAGTGSRKGHVLKRAKRKREKRRL